MAEYLKWWAIAAGALLVVVLCSQGAILIIEWMNTWPPFWRATFGFGVSSMIVGGFMKALFGRG